MVFLRFFTSFPVTMKTVLCCLFISFAVATILPGNDEDFDWQYNQPPSYQFPITQDGRQVMFEPNDWPGSYQTIFGQPQQTTPFPQTSFLLQNKPGLSPNAPSPGMPGETRRKMFQGASFAASYLPGWKSDNLEMTQARISATVGLPGLLENSFILLSPSFETTFFRWSGFESFPETLYTASLNCTFIKKYNERWSCMASIGPRWSSDGKETKDAVRCTLMGGMIWTHSRQWQIRFGVAYLNREDNFNILPFGGVIWTPNEDWKYELITPMFRIARRCRSFPILPPFGDETSYWGYAGIGFGGGTWAFQSLGSRPEVTNYSEFSVVMGLESKRLERIPWKIETGYVFARSMSFDRNTLSNFNPGNTILLRLVLSL